MSTPATPAAPAERRVPPLGGLNTTMVRLELRRSLRNRRTLVFALVLPAALFFVFGSGGGGEERVGEGNVSAYVMVSMALYGGALIAASAGTGVALERSLGWSRQLRLTPLHPAAYVTVKALVAVVMGAVAVTVVNVVGAAQGRPDMPLGTWLACAVLTLVCTLTFAALGVFVGYLVPGENAMQLLGPGLALLSFLGGLFIPLSSYSEAVRQVAYWTPMYGVAEVARSPLTHELPWYAVVNALGWLAVFVAGAAWRMSRDTARV
ncbi:ABC-2 type transport system permease protein [Nocardioides scoriae]|uniref:ABC-2 type transport system permease protein n=1 Tax=Nocardioides scoriae TaxID=642780 RepID=A0A1H1M656_9ACTN|nr:ABC transporter permease [Nocardioides scoriae]SDR81519.1 ABC-2 type transport system permease protein [Nocardioides scoriae]